MRGAGLFDPFPSILGLVFYIIVLSFFYVGTGREVVSLVLQRGEWRRCSSRSMCSFVVLGGQLGCRAEGLLSFVSRCV